MSADVPEPAEPGAQPRPEEEISTDRLITLSDGVVAIALTLLILDIAVPATTALHEHRDSIWALWDALSDTVANWISYVISFYTIAQFWNIHHRIFRGIRAHRGGLAGWNFLFLFTISVMPFTSKLLGDFPENPLSVILFAVNLILANLAMHAMLTFCKRNDLLTSQGLAVMAGYRSLAGAIDLSAYLVSIPVALYSPDLGKVCWLGLALSVPVAHGVSRLRGRRPAGG